MREHGFRAGWKPRPCTVYNIKVLLAAYCYGVIIIPDYTNSLTFLWLYALSLTFPWPVQNSLTFPSFQKFQKSGNPEYASSPENNAFCFTKLVVSSIVVASIHRGWLGWVALGCGLNNQPACSPNSHPSQSRMQSTHSNFVDMRKAVNTKPGQHHHCNHRVSTSTRWPFLFGAMLS